MTRALLVSAAWLALAAPALAQSQPRSAGDLTRDLNAAPPGAVVTPPSTANTPPPSRPATQPPVGAPAATRPLTNAAVRPPRNSTPAPSAPTASAAPATATAPTDTAEITPPPPPPAVLDAAAIRDLPFTVDVPRGLEIVGRKPAPDVGIYMVRKAGVPLVMIYAGPASQFPIYDGELVRAGGRSSLVVTEDGRRRAMEHLFEREASPAQIHVWVASVDGADRDLAERIAQSVDAR